MKIERETHTPWNPEQLFNYIRYSVENDDGHEVGCIAKQDGLYVFWPDVNPDDYEERPTLKPNNMSEITEFCNDLNRNEYR